MKDQPYFASDPEALLWGLGYALGDQCAQDRMHLGVERDRVWMAGLIVDAVRAMVSEKTRDRLIKNEPLRLAVMAAFAQGYNDRMSRNES